MIDFDINSKIKFTPDLRLIKKIVATFNESYKRADGKYFSLAFIGSAEMKRLNFQYRGKDRATDVLSFAPRDSQGDWPSDATDFGEIIICVPVARAQAKEYGWNIHYEISRLLIHGLSHLAGFEHENVDEKTIKKMENFERKILEKVTG
jgi:probable rRNA maturation factor